MGWEVMNMMLSKDEMHVLSALHAGTLSATVDVLRSASESDGILPERAEAYRALLGKLERKQPDEVVALGFDPE
jgi:hypothetical protein